MDLKSLGVEIAKIGLPLIGAALPVPGGEAIGVALASHIGSPSTKPEDILTTLTSTPEAIEKAKEFQLTHQETMLTITTNAEIAAIQAQTQDRTSARSMESTTKSFMPAILATLVMVAFLTLLCSVGLGAIHDSALLDGLIGSLSTIVVQIFTFYFGSTSAHGELVKTLSQTSQ